MRIKYGKGDCFLYFNGLISHISIKYRGDISLKHRHREIILINNGKVYFNNIKSKSSLYNNNNRIDIFFKKDIAPHDKLFNYNGDFRIISAKVNDKNIPIEVFGIDYPNLIDSKPESMGKPENYRGNYKYGRVPSKRGKKR